MCHSLLAAAQTLSWQEGGCWCCTFLTMELTCYMADEALMICSTRSVWLAKMSQTDTHFHTSAPETSSCTRTDVNWKLITERLKRGGDTFCICPSFDASRVVVIFRWCAKTHERIMKVSVCGRHPAHPVKLRANMSWCRNVLYWNVMFSG